MCISTVWVLTLEPSHDKRLINLIIDTILALKRAFWVVLLSVHWLVHGGIPLVADDGLNEVLQYCTDQVLE